MPITSTSPYTLGSSASIVIDCSKMFGNKDEGQEEQMVNILTFVRSYPQRSQISVVLGGHRNGHTSRKLHSRLQALGCTVIAKHNI